MLIRGLPQHCKTWDRIKDVVVEPPNIVPGKGLEGVSDTTGTASCPSRVPLFETFDNGKNGWTGKLIFLPHIPRNSTFTLFATSLRRVC